MMIVKSIVKFILDVYILMMIVVQSSFSTSLIHYWVLKRVLNLDNRYPIGCACVSKLINF